MKTEENSSINWTICKKCQGQGKKSRRPTKKAQMRYNLAIEQFEKSNGDELAPIRPQGYFDSCKNCLGSGLVSSELPTVVDTEKYPHVAIIGGGIGGIALAVAFLHRGIPFTIYERDTNFNSRSQGYGLTLQQASKAIEGLGIFSLNEGVISTRHVVHTTNGKIIGEWGFRNRVQSDVQSSSKRKNIHIARQSLRLALLEQLGGHESVHWNHQLIDYKELEDESVELNFLVDGNIKSTKADLVVGADGIRSLVRKLLIGDELSPLRYLDCIVILGICPLSALKNIDNSLLDSATVFQTANGNERIYIMPYSQNSIMWQLSFPMLENEAKELSAKGTKALKEKACQITQWHDPIPQILAATQESEISGYPVYDRKLITSELLEKAENLTLIGDAAHPMSPFKGQGANQALLDALALARIISKKCNPLPHWKTIGLRNSILTEFELKMIERSAIKVKDSAEAAKFLHSEIVLIEGDETRGHIVKKKEA